MKSKLIFCTLFDSNYLDKGLVLYRSLVETKCDFKLYILPMDEECKKIISSYQYNNIVILNYSDFISFFNLDKIVKTRSRGEFCWTCTPFLIKYVLSYYKEPISTYIDADMYFYSDPSVLIDEMGNKTVQIVPHRYNESLHGRESCKSSGTYCVQFNTFKNTSDSIELLTWWAEQCFKYCSSVSLKKSVFGDQGYLENWTNKNNVSVLSNYGGGVAPWNSAQYEFYNEDNDGIYLRNKKDKNSFRLVFYHYHNLSYLDSHTVNIGIYEPWKVDPQIVKRLYVDYLNKLDSVKNELNEKFGVYPLIKSHPAFTLNNTKKKNIFHKIKVLFSLFIPKNFYFKIIFRYKSHKYEHLNIIKF